MPWMRSSGGRSRTGARAAFRTSSRAPLLGPIRDQVLYDQDGGVGVAVADPKDAQASVSTHRDDVALARDEHAALVRRRIRRRAEC
jgi:hypothetical protein